VDRHIHGTAASRASGEQAAGWAGSTRIQSFTRGAGALLSVLSLDIETDPRADTVYAVGLAFQDRGRTDIKGEVFLNGQRPRSWKARPTA